MRGYFLPGVNDAGLTIHPSTSVLFVDLAVTRSTAASLTLARMSSFTRVSCAIAAAAPRRDTSTRTTSGGSVGELRIPAPTPVRASDVRDSTCAPVVTLVAADPAAAAKYTAVVPV